MRIKLILIALIAALAIFGYTITSYYISANKDKKEVKKILASKEKLFLNDSLQHASEVNVWRVRYSDLELAKEKQIKGIASDYEKKLAEAYDNVELYKRKNKDLILYYESLLSAKDTIYQPMPADCQLKPVRSKHIDIDFIYHDSLVGISYDYRTKISTLITLYPKRKANGNKHWPNWGFIWGWDKVSISTPEDRKATITDQIVIEFKR